MSSQQPLAADAGSSLLALFFGYQINVMATMRCYEWVSRGRYVHNVRDYTTDRLDDRRSSGMAKSHTSAFYENVRVLLRAGRPKNTYYRKM
jgi:hypothetical protein